jgi:purine-binding chemotaxis protein CheW
MPESAALKIFYRTATVEMVNDMENTAENILSKNDNKGNENIFKEKYLTFFIDEQLFAIPSSQVVEIIRMQPITYIPKLPPFVIGVINLRGKIVPLIDLRLKFNKEPREYDDYTSIIVVETGDLSVGFIVDRVNDVTDVSKNQISDSPKLAKDTTNGFITGIATLFGEAVMLLDTMKILSDDD